MWPVGTYFFIFLFVLVSAETGDLKITCSPSDESSLRVSLSSHRNESHHWITLVKLERETTSNSKELSLKMVQGTSKCSGREVTTFSNTIVVPESDPRQRRPDYELFPFLGYYKFHTTGLNWQDAHDVCMREEAHLLVINSDAEANVVKEFFKRDVTYKNTTDNKYIYIGYHDVFKDGHYVTVLGGSLENTGYVRWAPQQPDGKSAQNYGGVDKNGLLHDIRDDMRQTFICEQEF